MATLLATLTSLLAAGGTAAGGAAAGAAGSTAILSAGTIPTLASILPTAAAIGTGLTAAGTIYGGLRARQAGIATAEQLKAKAADERAIGQREAAQQRRIGRIAAGRAKVVAGASGAGVTDPTVTAIMSGIEQQGEYNALTELFKGSTSSAGLLGEAKSARREGNTALIGSLLDAGGTIYSEAARRRRAA